MVAIGALEIEPAFANSSCPWASDFAQLEELFLSEYTGAVTTRTATLDGFDEKPSVHMVAFASDTYSSINSYGYSPRPLKEYTADVLELYRKYPGKNKPIIISITSSMPEELMIMLGEIVSLRDRIDQLPNDESIGRYPSSRLIGVELNTSCPNIPGKPPPSYDTTALLPLLVALDQFNNMTANRRGKPRLTMGLKLPPYVHSKQFEDLTKALLGNDEQPANPHPISFITCTNTLGSSILFAEQAVKPSTPTGSACDFALPTVYGGLAGEAIHALALGNVHSFSKLLAAKPFTAHIRIIGVGGVTSPEAARRMYRAGASVVECATALGREGVSVFERLQKCLVNM